MFWSNKLQQWAQTRAENKPIVVFTQNAQLCLVCCFWINPQLTWHSHMQSEKDLLQPNQDLLSYFWKPVWDWTLIRTTFTTLQTNLTFWANVLNWIKPGRCECWCLSSLPFWVFFWLYYYSTFHHFIPTTVCVVSIFDSFCLFLFFFFLLLFLELVTPINICFQAEVTL